MVTIIAIICLAHVIDC